MGLWPSYSSSSRPLFLVTPILHPQLSQYSKSLARLLQCNRAIFSILPTFALFQQLPPLVCAIYLVLSASNLPASADASKWGCCRLSGLTLASVQSIFTRTQVRQRRQDRPNLSKCEIHMTRKHGKGLVWALGRGQANLGYLGTVIGSAKLVGIVVWERLCLMKMNRGPNTT